MEKGSPVCMDSGCNALGPRDFQNSSTLKVHWTPRSRCTTLPESNIPAHPACEAEGLPSIFQGEWNG